MDPDQLRTIPFRDTWRWTHTATVNRQQVPLYAEHRPELGCWLYYPQGETLPTLARHGAGDNPDGVIPLVESYEACPVAEYGPPALA